MQFFVDKTSISKDHKKILLFFYPITTTSNMLGVKQTYVYLIKFLVAKSITLWWRVFLEAKWLLTPSPPCSLHTSYTR